MRALRGRPRRDRGLGGRARRGRGEPGPARRPTADQAWPLPLDATALARRRAAAGTRCWPTWSASPSHADGQPRRVRPRTRTTTRTPPLGRRATDRTSRPADGRPTDGAPADEPPLDEDSDWDALPTERRRRYAGHPGRPRTPVREAATRTVPAARHPQEEPAAASPPRRPAPSPPGTGTSTPSPGSSAAPAPAVRDVPLPAALSATQLLRLAADPDGFARELARPMPRPPQPAARRGTRFHAWVESRFEELPLPLLGPDELPGATRATGDRRRARPGRAQGRVRAHPVRPAHAVPRGGAVPAHPRRPGRSAAVSTPCTGATATTATYEIVDWKTSRHRTADPLQLAVYRLAWAELHGLPLDAVTAAFLYVRSGEIVRPDGLPGRAELERILLDEPAPGRATTGAGRLKSMSEHPGQRRPYVHRAAPRSLPRRPRRVAAHPVRIGPARARRRTYGAAPSGSRAKLKETGFPVAEVWETPGAPAVFAEWPAEDPDAPTVLVYGHHDVQPAAREDGWDTDPFEPVVRDGRITRAAPPTTRARCSSTPSASAPTSPPPAAPTPAVTSSC